MIMISSGLNSLKMISKIVCDDGLETCNQNLISDPSSVHPLSQSLAAVDNDAGPVCVFVCSCVRNNRLTPAQSRVELRGVKTCPQHSD